MTCLILGAVGFVGSHLLEHLARPGEHRRDDMHHDLKAQRPGSGSEGVRAGA